MKWLFFADTPLQIYHASLLADSILSKSRVSLVIHCQFHNAKEIGSLLEKLQIFDEIFYSYPAKSVWEFRKIEFFDFLGMSCSVNEDIADLCVDYFALSCPTYKNSSFYFALRKNNPKIKVAFYDDGIGSYTGSIFSDPIYLGTLPEGISGKSLRQRIYRRIFTAIPVHNAYTPEILFLRQPQEIQYVLNFKVIKFEGKLDTREKIRNCFSMPSNNAREQVPIIFLDVPRKESERYSAEEVIDGLIEQCIDGGMNVALRVHPRTTQLPYRNNKVYDFSGGLWELICEESLSEESILIGLGSSAQLSPVLGPNKKPYLIFIHKLCVSKNDPRYRNQEKILRIALDLYGPDYADRVCAPTSMDEALSYIKNTMK